MAEVPYFTSLNRALVSLYGEGTEIVQKSRIFGGDINQAYKLVLSNGTAVFMKANTQERQSFFTVEAAGLAAIAQTKAIRTPHVLCTGTDEAENQSFLLMELVESDGRIPDFWETFAQQLAQMHRAETDTFVVGGSYGFSQDNFIGATAQVNTPCDSWISFFRDCRLKPQFQWAESYFSRSDNKKAQRLLDRLGDILVEPEHPSLLHGDLWSGNFMAGSDGRAWLIDPAAYVGHAEADIAMTELFGGFPKQFYDAYREAAPLQAGYEYRRDIYNLYHLLNHLNLFGHSYLLSVRRILDEYSG